MKITQKDIDRFWSKVDKTDSCWNWTAYKDSKGYGQFSIKNAIVYAHRFSYAIHNLEIDEMEVHHKCNNTSCVNPSHLEEVTSLEHRGLQYKEFCKNGHRLTLDSIIKNGPKQTCRECRLISIRRYDKKKRRM